MAAQSLPVPRFVRRTRLGPGEYRKNFHQIDEGVVAAVTSAEADLVTPLMSKIYLRLVNAPARYWEREGVLRFEAEAGEGRWATAWDALCETVGVASATARKALRWMHEQGVIGYYAGKNGVGVRIFLNRASSSIGVRPAPGGKKILEFSRASTVEPRASAGEAAFMDSYAVSESSDTDVYPRAPKNGADTEPAVNPFLAPTKVTNPPGRAPAGEAEEVSRSSVQTSVTITVGEIIERLKVELDPCVREASARAAAQTSAREMERTREWFETKALPKAARVAQRETYDLLRRHGALEGHGGRGSAGLEVGRGSGSHTAAAARPLSDEEIRETAEVCVALLEAQGKQIEVTLYEISSEGGGWLLPEDAPRVRELAMALASDGGTARPRTGDRA